MALTAALSSSLSSAAGIFPRPTKTTPSFHSSTTFHHHHHHHHHHSFFLRVANDADRSEVSSDTGTKASSYSEADKMVDGMDFGELCNEFECISSPLVESTARQLARDILEQREGNRALGVFAVSVTYKDPIRSFTGREKYKRALWATGALDNASVVSSISRILLLKQQLIHETGIFCWKPKSVIGGEDLILRITSKFTLNQISGQVIEHEEFWDLSASSASAQTFFWTSRALFSAIESVKDLVDNAKNLNSKISTKKENLEMYPDPSGDPTKFFQRDDSFQRDAYQIALFLAVIYLVVQFLRTTL
ncbi:uncharacterized protein HKW66_Vig0111400 [Vigna angularis]|uniref:Uncharacterized protein n=1 Tax=Phaseolus angularis TaxID=3914 RepID=A0A8T0KZA7_PHAAN|nr:uncharacterized protein HKW66_Vig0111400 [Vigna angularis]